MCLPLPVQGSELNCQGQIRTWQQPECGQALTGYPIDLERSVQSNEQSSDGAAVHQCAGAHRRPSVADAEGNITEVRYKMFNFQWTHLTNTDYLLLVKRFYIFSSPTNKRVNHQIGFMVSLKKIRFYCLVHKTTCYSNVFL